MLLWRRLWRWELFGDNFGKVKGVGFVGVLGGGDSGAGSGVGVGAGGGDGAWVVADTDGGMTLDSSMSEVVVSEMEVVGAGVAARGEGGGCDDAWAVADVGAGVAAHGEGGDWRLLRRGSGACVRVGG